MKYKKLHDNIAPTGKKAANRWRNILLNEKTGAIFPISRWAYNKAEEKKQVPTEIDSRFFFMPGNICIFNEIPISTFDLVPYGIPGKFEARKSIKSEYTYIHELFDKYESYPGMRVSMIDGKPLDARLLDKIELHPERLAQFEGQLKELKNVFFVVNRMGEKEPERWDWTSVGGRQQTMISRRRKLLIRLLTKPLDKTSNWVKALTPFYGYFWHGSYTKTKQHDKVFDNMIRFDKAALFRSLKVIE